MVSSNLQFGDVLRATRTALQVNESEAYYSLRQVAYRIDIEPAYLSKVERGEEPPPSETTIGKMAEEYKLDADVLLAVAGKVPPDVRAAIIRRPVVLARLIRALQGVPDDVIETLIRDANVGAPSK